MTFALEIWPLVSDYFVYLVKNNLDTNDQLFLNVNKEGWIIKSHSKRSVVELTETIAKYISPSQQDNKSRASRRSNFDFHEENVIKKSQFNISNINKSHLEPRDS